MDDKEPQAPVVPAHDEQPSSPPQEPSDETDSINISFIHHGTTHTFDFVPSATISDLSARIANEMHIPESHQKFMISPKTGLLKPPFSSTSTPTLETLLTKKITLLAPSPADLSSLSRPQPATPASSVLKPATPSRTHDWRKAQDEALCTFHTILPLPYLPNPSRSHTYLSRLASDPGIKASMRKHRFRVGILTEMDPAAHTTHESRTLGLNRNRGEVIELRLRTDAYDGYRDYKIIRDTLCHELAHNVYGEHDRDFWRLCREIEGEVRRGDWRSGGDRVGNQVYYDPVEGHDGGGQGGGGGHVDAGGWTGGEYVLGRGQSGVAPSTAAATAAASGDSSSSGGGGGAMNRREAMAKAAEERARKQRELGQGQGQGKGS